MKTKTCCMKCGLETYYDSGGKATFCCGDPDLVEVRADSPDEWWKCHRGHVTRAGLWCCPACSDAFRNGVKAIAEKYANHEDGEREEIMGDLNDLLQGKPINV